MKNNVFNNMLDMIGNTPVVKINKLNPYKNVTIYAKLEGQNPGGSVKDRPALNMIENAEKTGELTKDKIILEPTSGNTGIGLAMVASVKGYKITLTMSEGMSDERKKLLKALGAKLILTPAKEKTDGAIRKANEILKKDPKKYWMPNQFENQNNSLAHTKTTAIELLKQVPNMTHFVAGMGTSGTLMGMIKGFKDKVKVVGIEPRFGHKIAGLKNMQESIVPKIYDENQLYEKIVLDSDEEAFAICRALAKEEGICVGMSSGAAMVGALKLAKKIKKGVIVVLFPDRGERYLSTNLFDCC